MSGKPKLYIAGMGMITPVGANTEMTAAAVRAGISAYRISDFVDNKNTHVKMALVPNIIFDTFEANLDEGNRFNERHDRIIKMAILAIREACAKRKINQPVPLLFAMPEEQDEDIDEFCPLFESLENNCEPWVSVKLCRSFYSGRAAGIEAIAYAFRYLLESEHDYILIGGSDSYKDYYRLATLFDDNRVMVVDGSDGFVPGEAASFLLLTRQPDLAMERNGEIISINPPGIASETGHLASEEPYRGEGLDQAFKKALSTKISNKISFVYSSMNGEHHWAKEFGVASTRNRVAFDAGFEIRHPADIFGDTGAATSTTLLCLAADNLFSNSDAISTLVYSSSDKEKRAALTIEKWPVVSTLKRSNGHV